MVKAICSALITLILGYIFSSIGFDYFNEYLELGVIVAVSVMGGYIVYLIEKSNKNSKNN